MLDKVKGEVQKASAAGSRSWARWPPASPCSPRRTSRLRADPGIAGGDRGDFLLRVAGDSMIEAGIHDGDYVVVERRDAAADGEVVVALVGEEATVKTFFKENDHVRFSPKTLRWSRSAQGRPDPRRVVACSGRSRDGRGRDSLGTAPRPLPGRPDDRADANPRRSAHRSDGDRLTLEQLLEHAWEGLRAAGAAECPSATRGWSVAAAAGVHRLRQLPA